VIFPGALGDFLLALPALRALRSRHASAELTTVTAEPLRALATLAGVADATASLDAAEAARLFVPGPAPGWLAGRPLVYSWLGADDLDLRRRLSTLTAGARFFRVERGAGRRHAAAAYAAAVGAPAERDVLAAAGCLVPAASRAAAARFANQSPVFAIHPGAGARAKRWDVAGFVQVAQWWRSGGGSVLELAGPAEAGEAPVLGAPTIRDWALPDLAALLGRVALYLGHDSGISHLAGAVGAAGVVLYGATDPERWHPLAGRLVALRARTSGPDGISLAALPVARVVAACRRRFALTSRNPEISVGARELCAETAPTKLQINPRASPSN